MVLFCKARVSNNFLTFVDPDAPWLQSHGSPLRHHHSTYCLLISYDAFGLLAPYFERPWRRSATPAESNVPRIT